MRILIAPDAFKGSLSAAEAAGAMAAGIREAVPAAEIETMPLADGGEGTLDVLARHMASEVSPSVHDAFLQCADDDGNATALVESARCLGLTLPGMRAREVWQRGSGALGACISPCLDAGVRRFVIGLGGSATNDAGLGMLMTLGLRACDGQGGVVSPDLQGLCVLASLDASGIDARLAECEMTILCDVDVPLCGRKGATFTFGPQKDLPIEDLASVDQAMARFARLAEMAFERSANELPGSGAAGGVGFALALLGGRLVSGADYVIEKAGLAGKVAGHDWVLTGEGRSDGQTLAGKLPQKVASLARAAGVRTALISGDVADRSMLASAFDVVMPARPQGMTVETAMDQAASLLTRAARLWAETTCRN